ncbi:MAG: DUF885 family protein [Pseudomonadota bacterium]
MTKIGIRSCGKVLALTLVSLVLVTGCGSEEAPPPPVEAPEPPPPHPWTVFIDGQRETYRVADPARALAQGQHESARLLPDWSETGIRREVERLRAARLEAGAFVDDDLTPEMRFERDAFIARIDHDLFWLVKARWPSRNPLFYIGGLNDSLDPTPYFMLDSAPIEERMAAFIRYLEAIPEAGRQIRGNLRMPMPLTWLELGAQTFNDYARTLRDEAPDKWTDVADPAMQQRFARANEQAIATMTELAEWLAFGRNIADESFALGPALYQEMLWETERVRIGAEELLEAGRSDMERNLAELRNACTEFAPGLDVPNCLAKLSTADDSERRSAEPVTAGRAALDLGELEAIPGESGASFEGASPAARVQQLSDALLRDARFIVSINLQADGWSVDDARAFLMDEAYQSEDAASRQATRATYDPAYLRETLDTLLIQRLREDWTAERGGRAAWPEFHTAFLSFGSAPVPLIRQYMMGDSAPSTVLPEPVAVIAALPADLTIDAEQPRRQLNWAWDCEDGRYVVSSENAETLALELFVDQERRALERVRSASGVRYEGEDILFWTRGEEAMLELGDESTNCRINRYQSNWVDARLRGADFRGFGNEPGWYVELFSSEESVLVLDYGESTLRFQAAGPEDPETGSGSVFRGRFQGLDIVIELTPGPCQDTMADLEYETSVALNVGGRVLRGCGRPLD